MTDEQREEINRRQREYQREYRARRKAALQNGSNTRVVETGLSTTTIMDDESPDTMDWLHRNDNYVPVRRAPHTIISGPLPAYGDTGQHISDILNLHKIF